MPSADVVEKTPHDQYYKGSKYIISSRNTNLFDDMKRENISATRKSYLHLIRHLVKLNKIVHPGTMSIYLNSIGFIRTRKSYMHLG